MALQKAKISTPLPTRAEVERAVALLNSLADLRLTLRGGGQSATSGVVASATGSLIDLDLSKLVSGESISTIAYSATVNIDFATMAGGVYLIEPTGNLTLTMSGFYAGARVSLLLKASGSRTIFYPSDLRMPVEDANLSALTSCAFITSTRNLRIDFTCAGDSIDYVFTQVF